MVGIFTGYSGSFVYPNIHHQAHQCMLQPIEYCRMLKIGNWSIVGYKIDIEDQTYILGPVNLVRTITKRDLSQQTS